MSRTRKTGYGLFFENNLKIEIEKGNRFERNENIRMWENFRTQCNSMWYHLSEEEKQKWNDKASNLYFEVNSQITIEQSTLKTT